MLESTGGKPKTNSVIWALEDWQGELIALKYKISIWVIMGVFSQFTRLKEYMPDLLDLQQFMRQLVIRDI